MKQDGVKDSVFMVVALALYPILLFGCMRTSSNEERYTQLLRTVPRVAGRPDAERTAAIVAEYRALFGEGATPSLSSLSERELRALFDARALLASYTRQIVDVEGVNRIFLEMEARGVLRREEVEVFDGLTVAVRDFDRAAALRERFSQLEPLPRIIKGEARTKAVWHFEPTTSSIVQREFSQSHKARIVVIGHPLCHPSLAASETIAADSELAGLFADALWLAPPGPRIDFGVFVDWNGKRPSQQFVLAHAKLDWPEIDYWGTPTFYFFDDKGNLVSKVQGWPSSGRVNELKRAARIAGL